MGGKFIFMLLTAGIFILKKADASTCSNQMDQFRTCVRNQMQQDQSDSTANENRRNQMMNDVRSCCQNNGCQDPYPSSQERSAREQCFKEARTTIRNQLQSCVGGSFSNFQLPGDDNDKDAYWNFILRRSFAAVRSIGNNRNNRNQKNSNKWNQAAGNQPSNDVCGNDDNKKNRTAMCIQSRGVFNKTSANSNWRKNSCRIKRQCNSTITQQCQQEWDNNQKPKLCDCVSQSKSKGDLQKVQNQYIQCLKNKRIQVRDENNDDGRQIVAGMLTGWCSSGKVAKGQQQQADPCSRRRSNRGRGNGQNGQNGNGQNGRNWNGQNWNGQNGGQNGQNGNWNGQNWNGNNQNGQNWNGNQNGQNWNGNSQSSSNQNWNSQSSSSSSQNWNGQTSDYDVDYPYQQGSVQSGSPFDEMLGGSPLSGITGGGGGPLSAITGGGGGPLSALTGGGGGSPLDAITGGGGGGFGSILQSFTGGGGGSPLDALGGLAGGGGSPLDTLGAFGGGGGGVMDAFGGGGNLLGAMSAIGGKKKK